MKIRMKKGGPVTEQPDEQAKVLVDAGLWYAADDKDAKEPEAESQPKGSKKK